MKNPQLDVDAVKTYRQTDGSYGTTYSAQERQYFRGVAAIADRNATAMGFSKSLFDIGCGEGFFAADSHTLGWAVKCSDLSSLAVEKMNPALVPVFHQGDADSVIERATSAGEKFGVVGLQNVLERVKDPAEILLKIKKLVVVDHGGIRIKVKNNYAAYKKHIAGLRVTPSEWFASPQDMTLFSRESLISTIELAGYDVLSVQAELPIEPFLLQTQSSYWKNGEVEPSAHQSRIVAENFIMADLDAYIEYATAVAKVGFGCDLVAYARPK